jgi:hypothetical protein
MPDQNGICRCGGVGWNDCRPSRPMPPPLDPQLLARLRATSQGIGDSVFHRAAMAATTGSPSSLGLTNTDVADLATSTSGRELPSEGLGTNFISLDRRRVGEGR